MDYFALLAQPRQPWLDPDSLKTAFLEQSARLHPDRVQAASEKEKAAATGRFAELNAAYNCLREPKERLLHLLELESGAPPTNVQSVPEGTMDLFMETGQLCRETDQFLAANGRPTSPLLQVQRLVQNQERTVRLQELQARIQLRRNQLLAELHEMNAAWNAAPPAPFPGRPGTLPLRRLEEMARTLSYIARCAGQVQERLAQLLVSS
jgi:DnaJ-domain-containing protein 1